MSTLNNKNDNQLIQIFLPIIQNGLVADGFTNVITKQSNQPTQQGINTSPTIYFFKVSGRRYGFLGRYDKWNSTQMTHTENQYMEATFQIMALVLQNPITPNQYTASDLVYEVSSIMQSDNTRDILNESGIGILRVTDLLNPYFLDDRDQFEASPSFDFTLTYLNSRQSVSPIITNYDYNIIPI